ncbi:2OG-Fe(II) oxygenase family protein [Streptomyces sp. NPDC054796]
MRWNPAEHARLRTAMSSLKEFLSGTERESTFPGMDKLEASRQSFWVAARGLHRPLVEDEEFLGSLDGDRSGGRRGAEILRSRPDVSSALERVRRTLDGALLTAARAVTVPRDVLRGVTVRYRVVRYAAGTADTSGIGLHPDGNVLSALVTDGDGLTLWQDRNTFVSPERDGTLVLPGSILYRWSEGHYEPTFHRVELDERHEPKFSMVAFLNFPDKAPLAYWRSGGTRLYFNDVQASKESDLDRFGDIAELWKRFF